MDKGEAGILSNILLEYYVRLCEQFSFASKDEQEQFFSENVEFNSLHFLLVPSKIYVLDENGNKSSLPLEFFSNDLFYISRESDLVTQALDLWMSKELIRNEFFVFGALLHGYVE